MLYARELGIPVVTIAQSGSHYNRESCELLGQLISPWVHPFIEALSVCVVEDLKEAGAWISALDFNQTFPFDVSALSQHYLDTQLEADLPMQKIIGSSERLQAKLARAGITLCLS